MARPIGVEIRMGLRSKIYRGEFALVSEHGICQFDISRIEEAIKEKI